MTMRLYFSSSHTFREIFEQENKDELIDAFNDRVDGFYLRPAKILNAEKYGFAAGLLCVAAIDLLATLSLGRHNFTSWTCKNIDGLMGNSSANERFYKNFRNGLVHEGRIKNGDQFSYTISGIDFDESQKIMLVNPTYLLEQIKSGFNRYLDTLKRDNSEFDKFNRNLKDLFEKEIRLSLQTSRT